MTTASGKDRRGQSPVLVALCQVPIEMWTANGPGDSCPGLEVKDS